MSKPQRPLSPHLQIYRLPLTAWLSITHRITGVLLVVGMLFFTVALIVLANHHSAWEIINNLSSYSLTRLFLIVLCFCFWLHWLHGLRHLLWDTGAGFNLKHARLMDALEITFAIVLTAAVCITHLLMV